MFSRWQRIFHELLHQPIKIFTVGLFLTIALLFYDGSFWRYWSLQSNQLEMRNRISEIEAKSKKLEFELHEAKKLTYIERQATDQFDYVREGDLIFVFSE